MPKRYIAQAVNFFLGHLGYALIKNSSLQKLSQAYSSRGLYELLVHANPKNKQKIALNLEFSTSQFLQDLFVLNFLNFKRNGYFVEFGATDGISLSNTYMMEKKFGWKGIVAEPSLQFDQMLKNNRNCSIDYRCVFSETGKKIKFSEIEGTGLSQLAKYIGKDSLSFRRVQSKSYDVETVSLEDLLSSYNAPSCIDYLSIDVEGAEYDVLRDFDFRKYSFRVITIEHNFTESREKIYKLLTSTGYKRVFESISTTDDWYVYDKQ